MKSTFLFCWLLSAIILNNAYGQNSTSIVPATEIDYIQALKDTLDHLSEKSDNLFFKLHCNSMVSVINSKSSFTSQDSMFLENTYDAFNNQSDPSGSKELSTYLNRRRPFILSWISPTDGTVSFSWLNPPKNWNPEGEYPLYIQLHGLWNVASNSIEYMTYPFLQSASASSLFEDGYLLSPWGRGNLWYQGISEKDIWECIDALEKIVQINPARKYLSGHSMGGYGAWFIASKSPGTWAALGIHAGALWYNNGNLVSSKVAEALKDVPTYFVCGTNDDLLAINRTAFNLLANAGNLDIRFVTFLGGHEYIEENVENMYLWMRNFVNEDLNTGHSKSRNISSHPFRISCYPNPASAYINLVCSGPENTPVSISIFDLYGRQLTEVTGNTGNSTVFSLVYDATGLAQGIYFIRLKSGDRIAESKVSVVK